MKSVFTIRDIAQKANTSISTVSRILNGDYNSNRPLHRQIKQLLEESGYRRQKKSNTTKNILCVNTQTQINLHEFLIEKSLEKQALSSNFNLVFSRTDDPLHIERNIKEFNIKSIIFLSKPQTKPTVPSILINWDDITDDYTSVCCDNFAGLKEAFRHLKEQGHKRIAYFCDYKKSIFETNMRRSNIPWLYNCLELDFDEELIYYCNVLPFQHDQHIEKCVEKFLKMQNPPTAIALPADYYAANFYKYLKEKGLNIPTDMSVIGFDDDPVSSRMSPALTTLRKPFDLMVKEALRLISEILEDDDKMQKILIKPDIIIRDSTTSPRTR